VRSLKTGRLDSHEPANPCVLAESAPRACSLTRSDHIYFVYLANGGNVKARSNRLINNDPRDNEVVIETFPAEPRARFSVRDRRSDAL